MVRAILEGRKMQARRIINQQPPSDLYAIHTILATTGRNSDIGKHRWMLRDNILDTPVMGKPFSCPYGYSGDRLWVRETWAPADALLFGGLEPDECDAVAYKADKVILGPKGQHFNTNGIAFEKIKWRPSIHMRRDYSRLLLEVEDVRVERLLEISEQDAISEGVEQWPDGNWKSYGKYAGKYSDARNSFLSLWNSINGENADVANPWVWVITFKRIEA